MGGIPWARLLRLVITEDPLFLPLSLGSKKKCQTEMVEALFRRHGREGGCWGLTLWPLEAKDFRSQ